MEGVLARLVIHYITVKAEDFYLPKNHIASIWENYT